MPDDVRHALCNVLLLLPAGRPIEAAPRHHISPQPRQPLTDCPRSYHSTMFIARPPVPSLWAAPFVLFLWHLIAHPYLSTLPLFCRLCLPPPAPGTSSVGRAAVVLLLFSLLAAPDVGAIFRTAAALNIDASAYPDGTTLVDIDDGSLSISNLLPGRTLRLRNVKATWSCDIPTVPAGARLEVDGLTTETLNIGGAASGAHFLLRNATALYRVQIPTVAGAASFVVENTTFPAGASVTTIRDTEEVVFRGVTALSKSGGSGLTFSSVENSKLVVRNTTFAPAPSGGSATGLVFANTVRDSTVVVDDTTHAFPAPGQAVRTLTFEGAVRSAITITNTVVVATASSATVLTTGTNNGLNLTVASMALSLQLSSTCVVLRFPYGLESGVVTTDDVTVSVVAGSTVLVLEFSNIMRNVSGTRIAGVAVDAVAPPSSAVDVVTVRSGLYYSPGHITITNVSVTGQGGHVGVVTLDSAVRDVACLEIANVSVGIAATVRMQVATFPALHCAGDNCSISVSGFSLPAASPTSAELIALRFTSVAGYDTVALADSSIAHTAGSSPILRALVFTSLVVARCLVISSVSLHLAATQIVDPGFASGLRVTSVAITSLRVTMVGVEGTVSPLSIGPGSTAATVRIAHSAFSVTCASCTPTGIHFVGLGPPVDGPRPTVIVTDTVVAMGSVSFREAGGMHFGAVDLQDLLLQHSTMSVACESSIFGLRFSSTAAVAGTIGLSDVNATVAGAVAASGLSYAASTLGAFEADRFNLTVTSRLNAADGVTFTNAVAVGAVRFVDSTVLASTGLSTHKARAFAAFFAMDVRWVLFNRTALSIDGGARASAALGLGVVTGLAAFVVDGCSFLVLGGLGAGLLMDEPLRRSASVHADLVALRNTTLSSRGDSSKKHSVLRAAARRLEVSRCVTTTTVVDAAAWAMEIWAENSVLVVIDGNAFRTEAASMEARGLTLRYISPTDAPRRVEVTGNTFDLRVLPFGTAEGMRELGGMEGARVLLVAGNDFSPIDPLALTMAVFTLANNRLVLAFNTFPTSVGDVINREPYAIRCNHFADSTLITATTYRTGHTYTVLPCGACGTELCDHAPGYNGTVQLTDGVCRCGCSGSAHQALPLLQHEACVTATYWTVAPPLVANDTWLADVLQRPSDACGAASGTCGVAAATEAPSGPGPTAAPADLRPTATGSTLSLTSTAARTVSASHALSASPSAHPTTSVTLQRTVTRSSVPSASSSPSAHRTLSSSVGTPTAVLTASVAVTVTVPSGSTSTTASTSSTGAPVPSPTLTASTSVAATLSQERTATTDGWHPASLRPWLCPVAPGSCSPLLGAFAAAGAPLFQLSSSASGVPLAVAVVGSDGADLPVPGVPRAWALTASITDGRKVRSKVNVCPRFTQPCRVVVPWPLVTAPTTQLNATVSMLGFSTTALVQVAPPAALLLTAPSAAPWPAASGVELSLSTPGLRESVTIRPALSVGPAPVAAVGTVAAYVGSSLVDVVASCLSLHAAARALLAAPAAQLVPGGVRDAVRLPFRVPAAEPIRRHLRDLADCAAYLRPTAPLATVTWHAVGGDHHTATATTELHDCTLAAPVTPAVVGPVLDAALLVHYPIHGAPETQLTCVVGSHVVAATRDGPCSVRCATSTLGSLDAGALTVEVVEGARRAIIGELLAAARPALSWPPALPAVLCGAAPTPSAIVVELRLVPPDGGEPVCRPLHGLLHQLSLNATVVALDGANATLSSSPVAAGFVLGTQCSWRLPLPALSSAAADRSIVVAVTARIAAAGTDVTSSERRVVCPVCSQPPLPPLAPPVAAVQRLHVSGCLDAHPATGDCPADAVVVVKSSLPSPALLGPVLLAPAAAVPVGAASVLNASTLHGAVLCARPPPSLAPADVARCRLPIGAVGASLRLAVGAALNATVVDEATFEADPAAAIAAFTWTTVPALVGTVSLQAAPCPVGGLLGLSCSGHGVCTAGACVCTASPTTGYWGGHDCGRCSAWSASAANGTMPCAVRCPGAPFAPCSGHGTCRAGGVCECAAGHVGSDCSRQCPTLGGVVCGGHGVCNASTGGLCLCNSSRVGTACGACAVAGAGCVPFGGHGLPFDAAVCPHSTATAPPTVCSGHGQCSTTLGACTCVAGYAGGACGLQCPGDDVTGPCSGHGQCGPQGRCSCSPEWDGADCGRCAAGFGGPRCHVRCPSGAGGELCGGHGKCNADGRCECDASEALGYWSGAACDECRFSHGGTSCRQECPTAHCEVCGGHGRCGVTTVDCSCEEGWAGIACDRCTADRYGPACAASCPVDARGLLCGGHGTCDSGLTGTGACTCSVGFTSLSTTSSNRPCGHCSVGFYGPECRPCGRSSPQAAACSGHGACSDGDHGTGACVCDTGWGGARCGGECGISAGVVCGASGLGCGPDGCVCRGGFAVGVTLACDACAPLHFGPACTPCGLRCGAHGTCRDGAAADGGCDCSAGWRGARCTVQCPVSATGLLCSGHGTCTAAGLCHCAASVSEGYWAGPDCGRCSSFFSGPSCALRCPVVGGRVCNGRGHCDATGRCVDCGPSVALGDAPTERVCGSACHVLGACTVVVGSTNCAGAVPAPSGVAGVVACSAHGWCDEAQGRCHCFSDFLGDACAAQCPPCAVTGTCLVDEAGAKCECGPWSFGPRCDGVCPGTVGQVPCSAHGSCHPTTGHCSCAAGYGGPACGSQCPVSSDGQLCGGRGACDQATGQCRCDATPTAAFGGADCTACRSGFSGLDCAVACVHGTTVERECRCFAGYGGLGCVRACAVGSDRVTPCSGHGQCSSVTAQCNCSAAWYGTACAVRCDRSECEATYGWAHGECSPDGACRCLASDTAGHWGGPRCDDCAVTHWGPSCTVPCMCGGHGTCDRIDGQCECHRDPDAGFWAGPRCAVCASGYVGSTCAARNLPLSTTAALTRVLPLSEEFDRPALLAAGGAPPSTAVLWDARHGVLFSLTTGAAAHLAAVRTAGAQREVLLSVHLPPLPGPAALAVNDTHCMLYAAGAAGVTVHTAVSRDPSLIAAVTPTAATGVPGERHGAALATLVTPAVLLAAPAHGIMLQLRARSPRRLTPLTPAVDGSLQAVSLRNGAVLYDEATLPVVFDVVVALRPEESGSTSAVGDVVLVAGSTFVPEAPDSASLRSVWAAQVLPLSTLALPGTAPVPLRPPAETAADIAALECTAAEKCVPMAGPSGGAAWVCVLRCSGGQLVLASGLATTPGGTGSVTQLEAEAVVPTVDTGRGTKAELQQRLHDALTAKVRAVVTAMALDHATGRVFLAVNDNRRFLSRAAPGAGTRGGGTTLLTVDLARATVAGVVHRGVSSRVLAIAVLAGDMALVSLVAGEGLSVESGNLVAIAAVTPAVVDSRLLAVVTVHGAGFVHANASAECLFADGHRAVSASSPSSLGAVSIAASSSPSALDTVVCRVAPLRLPGGVCASVSVGIGTAGHRVATGVGTELRPVATVQLAAASNPAFPRGPPVVRAGERFAVSLHGQGFADAERAVCRTTDSAGRRHTFPAAVNASDHAACSGVAPALPSTPPAILEYSHDGVAFSRSVPFAFVGSAAGIIVEAPATTPSGEAAAIAGLTVRAIDSFGNVLGTAAGRRPEIVRCAVAETNATAVIAAFTNAGTAQLPPLALGRPKVGRLVVTCAARQWLAVVATVVVPGPPHHLTLATDAGRPPPSWVAGTTAPRLLVPNVTVAVADAAGNILSGDRAAGLPPVLRASWTNVLAQPYRAVPHVTTTARTTAGYYRFGADIAVQGLHGASVVLTFTPVAVAGSPSLPPLEVALPPEPCTTDGSAFAMLNTTLCRACPAFAVCDGSSALRGRSSALTFYDCRPPYAAAACTEYGSCGIGYDGPLCSVCEAGYGRSGEKCQRCSAAWYNWLVTAAIVVAVGVVVWLLAWQSINDGRDPDASKRKASLAVKALLSHLQLSGIAGAAALDLPGSLQTVFRRQEEAGSPFSFDLAFFSCEFAPRHRDRLAAADALCGAVIAVAATLQLCFVVAKHGTRLVARLRDDGRGQTRRDAVGANRAALYSDRAVRNAAPRGTAYFDMSFALSVSGSCSAAPRPRVEASPVVPCLSPRQWPSPAALSLSTSGRSMSLGTAQAEGLVPAPAFSPRTKGAVSRPVLRAVVAAVRGAVKDLLELLLVAAVVLLFLAFPALFELAGSAFRCDTFDYGAEGTRHFLAADRSYDCDTTEHTSLVRDAALHLAALGVGLPLITVAAVVAVSRVVYSGSMTKARALFFYITGGYTTDRWWWEAVILARKALVLVATFAVADPVLRVYGMIWVVSGAAILAAVAPSFDDPLLALLERLSLLCVAVTLNASLLFIHAGDGAAFWLLVVVVVAVNAAVALVCLYIFAVSFYATAVDLVPTVGGVVAALRAVILRSSVAGLEARREKLRAALAGSNAAGATGLLRAYAEHVQRMPFASRTAAFQPAAVLATGHEGKPCHPVAAPAVVVDAPGPEEDVAADVPDAQDIPQGISELESHASSPEMPALAPPALPAALQPVVPTPTAGSRASRDLSVDYPGLGLSGSLLSLRPLSPTLFESPHAAKARFEQGSRRRGRDEERRQAAIRQLLAKHRREVLATHGAGYFLDHSTRQAALFASGRHEKPQRPFGGGKRRRDRRAFLGRSSSGGLSLMGGSVSSASAMQGTLQARTDRSELSRRGSTARPQWPPAGPALRAAAAHFIAAHTVVTGSTDKGSLSTALSDLATFFSARAALAAAVLEQLRAERKALDQLLGVSEIDAARIVLSPAPNALSHVAGTAQHAFLSPRGAAPVAPLPPGLTPAPVEPALPSPRLVVPVPIAQRRRESPWELLPGIDGSPASPSLRVDATQHTALPPAPLAIAALGAEGSSGPNHSEADGTASGRTALSSPLPPLSPPLLGGRCRMPQAASPAGTASPLASSGRFTAVPLTALSRVASVPGLLDDDALSMSNAAGTSGDGWTVDDLGAEGHPDRPAPLPSFAVGASFELPSTPRDGSLDPRHRSAPNSALPVPAVSASASSAFRRASTALLRQSTALDVESSTQSTDRTASLSPR